MAKLINYAVLHSQVFVKDVGQLPERLDVADPMIFSKKREFSMSLQDNGICLRLKDKAGKFVEIQVPMTNVSHYVLATVEV